ncbi:late sexual development protein [Hyaloscypha sp. PMI_1271]|nr:late sexual development protein [Hyaloscypha sp. PMI_1271]
MRSSSLLLASAGLAAAAPFSYPLANGFPNLNSTELELVYKLAGGTLPNGALPSTLKPNGVQALQLIAANELFEVAYFTELVHNITSKVRGYSDGHHQYIIDTLTSVINQEEVHVLAANGVLASANKTTIQPCQYDFPVTDFRSAIALAQTFTDVVLGVLPVAQGLFAADGGDENALVPIIGSIIGQEGEQSGYYRFLQKKVASAAPLLTGGAPQFAYTAISQFIVPGSCPNIEVIGLKAFPALTLESTPRANNSVQTFSVPGAVSAANATLVYISGQNLPVSVPISNVTMAGNKTTFAASFPYQSGFDRGLTLGALVAGANKMFNSTADVAASTLFGPALIEVD